MRWKPVYKDYTVYHKWFAWHPVQLDDDTFVWLETVERRMEGNYGYWKSVRHYRVISANQRHFGP